MSETAQPIARPLEIAIVITPGFMPIDVIGFQTCFGMLRREVNIHFVWKDLNEVIGMPYFPTRATTTFEQCPRNLDILYAGAVPAKYLEDEQTLAFLSDRGSRAGWIAASCAGALLMGAAGLLRGYRATTNFHSLDQLAYYGALRTRGNVVEDRNRITAGPATGSTEIGLRLLQVFCGDEVAKLTELNLEYAPTPLFGVGTPELAGPELTRRALTQAAPLLREYDEVGRRAAARLGIEVPAN
ncbi:DJ-1/PfpI family protein [Goodfellowiella coeruleoviolacea]|uniref:DJ-1/PfpI family protein n=1 Tax=Goodfellowiella coeruleoviolacea TaxID=334858 RepID=A0AAE3G7S2_9PSEU|nr:DJ-1/PfpI family protein [Goodfellowiella coeruleoviolacea]MCP2163276.1 DJ-1/PfpI family protein [Goodfellowiella coeruleoviolacea]